MAADIKSVVSFVAIIVERFSVKQTDQQEDTFMTNKKNVSWRKLQTRVAKLVHFLKPIV